MNRNLHISISWLSPKAAEFSTQCLSSGESRGELSKRIRDLSHA